MYDVLVIGGGPAGVTAALRARELGASVGLVERNRMGGTCTNDGCVPTRVLAKAARLARDAEQFAQYGLSGTRPEVDLPALLARTQETVYRIHEKKQLLGHLRDAGADVFDGAGQVRFVDPNTLELGDGRRLAGQKFILCAGGQARRLSFPGSDLALTHSDVWTLEKTPGSLVIIGGAATGCQLASIFAAFGSRVWVLDVAPNILGAEDEAVSEAMAGGFRARGMEVVTGIGGVEGIEAGGKGQRLSYRLGGRVETIAAEVVVMAVGWVGNVNGLNLEAAGVAHERGYVVANECFQTTAGHIWAAGDIIGRIMLVQTATEEGRLAAENAVLGGERCPSQRVVPHGGFTDPEYASVGLTEAQARAAGPYAAVTVPYGDLDRAVIDGRPEGFCKLIVSPENGRLLGAHVVGEQALEVVQIAAAGMASGMHVRQLAELELAYPTFTAVLGLAARQLVRALDLTPLSPEWRSLRRRAAEWELRDG
jgi:pyruvate/2-oxoglutarate dehydrogenase complex dihydrolipoamide dehydrogenase (E3) component